MCIISCSLPYHLKLIGIKQKQCVLGFTNLQSGARRAGLALLVAGGSLKWLQVNAGNWLETQLEMEARGFCPSPCEFLQTDLPAVLLGFLHSMVAGYKVKVSGDSSGNWHNFPSPIYWWFVCRTQISGRGIYYFSMTGETAFGGYILPFWPWIIYIPPPCSMYSSCGKKSQRLHLTPASGTRSRNKISSSKSCLGVDTFP